MKTLNKTKLFIISFILLLIIIPSLLSQVVLPSCVTTNSEPTPFSYSNKIYYFVGSGGAVGRFYGDGSGISNMVTSDILLSTSNAIAVMIGNAGGVSLTDVTNVANSLIGGTTSWQPSNNTLTKLAGTGAITNLTGNAIGFTNLSATNIVGQLTNNTTGNANTATLASNVAGTLTNNIIGNAANATNWVNSSTTNSSAILQSATNYANGITNSSIVRQTQLTAASNDITTQLSSVLQSSTNYANGITNSSIVRQTQLTAASNALSLQIQASGISLSDATNVCTNLINSATNFTSIAVDTLYATNLTGNSFQPTIGTSNVLATTSLSNMVVNFNMNCIQLVVSNQFSITNFVGLEAGLGTMEKKLTIRVYLQTNSVVQPILPPLGQTAYGSYYCATNLQNPVPNTCAILPKWTVYVLTAWGTNILIEGKANQ